VDDRSGQGSCDEYAAAGVRTSPEKKDHVDLSMEPGGVVTSGMVIYDTMKFAEDSCQHHLPWDWPLPWALSYSAAESRAAGVSSSFRDHDPPAAVWGGYQGGGHRS